MNYLKQKANTLLLWCCVALLLPAVSSCQQAKLKAAVMIIDKQCPIDMGQTGQITSVKYEGDKVEYTLTLNEQLADIKKMRENSAQTLSALKTMFQAPEGEVKELLELVVASNSSMVFTYVGNKSGEKASFVLTTNELKQLLDQKMTAEESSLAKLKQTIESPAAQLPMKVDAVTTLTQMSLSDSDVVYLYQIDEAACPMDKIIANGEQMKAHVLQTLSSDPSAQMLVGLCLDCDKGIYYRYVGDKSGKAYEFRVSPEELNSLMTTNE
ncbi:MAG: hypothetical protein LBN24_07430 [Mediterranea sp.]|jgi:hypothetical protein|nr:hypothetical protein [Mediterranea sp.]